MFYNIVFAGVTASAGLGLVTLSACVCWLSSHNAVLACVSVCAGLDLVTLC